MYVYSCNVAGFLPDGEPQEFDSFDEAKRGLIAQIMFDADDAGMFGDDALADSLDATAQDVNLWTGPDSVTVPRSLELLPLVYEIVEVA